MRAKSSVSPIWLAVVACAALIVVAFSLGASYTAISQAQQATARARLGQLDALLALAENDAIQAGLEPPAIPFRSMAASFGENTAANSEYEQHVMEYMLRRLGEGRDFDFAIQRYEDSTGLHTYLYFFPQRGQTDMRMDPYFMARDGVFSGSGR